MTGQGRGRPSNFTPDLQHTYLELVTAGVRLGDAAAKVGIDRRRITYAKNTQPPFARALQAARAKGREARANPALWPHGKPGTYTNLGCRCTPCTRAGTTARAHAPDRAHTISQQPPERDGGAPTGATVHPLPGRTRQPLAAAS